MRVRMPAAVFAALALLMPGARAQAAKKPAQVVPAPVAVVIPRGETVQLSALALTKKLKLMRGVKIKWRSTASKVAKVDRNGLLTAVAKGRAFIIARAGKKQARVPVRVVGATSTAGLGQVRHVTADDQAVYWTENDAQSVRVRKMLKSNGAILDLAREPATGETGLKTTYLDLRLAGDSVFWSSFVEGFETHAAILSVPKSGGLRQGALPFDTGYVPMVSTAWGVSGKYLIAALTRPASVASYLPVNTRIAALDTETGQWKALVRGLFRPGSGFIVAGDDTYAYVRALTEAGRLVTLRVDPTERADDFEVLLDERSGDVRYGEQGASDGTYLYYWAGDNRNDARLLRLAVAGGEAPLLINDGQYGAGLVTDGTNVYWIRSTGSLLSLPVSGGTTSRLAEGLAPEAAVAGLGQDANSLYGVRSRGASSTIIGVNK